MNDNKSDQATAAAALPPASIKPRNERLDPALVPTVRRDPPHNLSIPEAAAYLGVSPRKVRLDIAARRLTAVRLGGRVLLRLVDLQRDLARLTLPAL